MIDLRKIKTIAVVGAGNNPTKYGYKVMADLMSRGFTVWPVNLKEKTVLNQPAYVSLSALPTVPELVVLVIPPESGLAVVKEAVALGVGGIWLQPGAESVAMEEFLQTQTISWQSKACIMLHQ